MRSGLNHWQFQHLLVEMSAQHRDEVSCTRASPDHINGVDRTTMFSPLKATLTKVLLTELFKTRQDRCDFVWQHDVFTKTNGKTRARDKCV